jgi:hypothetical protein
MTVMLSEYLDRLNGIDEDRFVGCIVTYTITDLSITRADVVKHFFDLGLDERLIPQEIQAIDAFRKVTTNAKLEYPVPFSDDGNIARVMIREVKNEPEKHVRHIIRETVDMKGKVLSYDRIGEAIFYRTPHAPGGGKPRYSLPSQLLEPEIELPTLSAWIHQIQADYVHKADHLDAQSIRGVVRNYIISLNGIAVKPSGGVYFVHSSRQDIIDKLQQFVALIPGKSVLYTIPLLDTQEQREMLTEAFQTEIEEECADLLKTIANTGKATQKTCENVLTRYSLLRNRSMEYTKVLGLSQERAAAALELAYNAYTELFVRVGIASG